MAHNKQIMSLAGTHTRRAASPFLHTCLRPIFGSWY